MKAVILAGGEGSRLRPLTCTLPKPMAKILGKPIIEYIFDILCVSGVTDAAITLGYLPHIIEENYENGYKNLNLEFFREEEPLGTAGSVKIAAAGFDEPFAVISGDALCNFDIKKIMDYHKASGAKITIVATDADNPCEYGIVKADKENRVLGFVEKPSWTQAVSNLANTGVYIINPECLELIPKNKKYDFASDLFPLMLERDMPIYCYHTAEYWCDVGNIEAYLKCQRDAFDKKIKPPAGSSASGIYSKKELPDGDYSIVPPVYIGEKVEIEEGAVIGPYTVIDDNCFIGKNAKIRYSAVLENSWIACDSSVTGALVCSGAALKKRSSLFEGCVAGSGSVIGENAAVKPSVRVWPGKIIGNGAAVNSDVRYGNIKAKYLSDGGVDEAQGVRLDVVTCTRLGLSLGNSSAVHRVGIANDGSACARMMQNAVVSGLIASGCSVWDFGESFDSQLKFLVNMCGVDAGLFVCGSEERSISICDGFGLSVPRYLEREIERGMSLCEFCEASAEKMKETSDMSDIKHLYMREIMKQAPYGLEGIGVSFESKNEAVKNMLFNCVSKLGAEFGNELVFEVDEKGATVCALTKSGKIGHDKLLAVCCLDEMRKGKNIAIPYDAPDYLDKLAENCGRKSLRYLGTPADNSDFSARKLAEKQFFVRDGLFLAVKLLSVMKEKNCTLDRLVSEIPQKYIVEKSVGIDFSPSYLSAIAGVEKVRRNNNYEGVRVVRSEGRLLVIPERNGEKVRIFAEADTMETAEEMCADMENIINSVSEKNKYKNI